MPFASAGNVGMSLSQPAGSSAFDICCHIFASSGSRFAHGLYFCVPVLLPLRAALNGLAHVLLHFVGNQELRIRRPAVCHLGQAYFFFAQRFAVRFLGVLPVGRAPADMRVDDDQRRTRHFALRRADGDVDQIQIIYVADVQHIPVPAAEARSHVIGECQRGAAFDGDVIVVVKPDQVRQAEMPGDRSGFVADAFHQVAIAAEGVDAIVEKIAVFLSNFAASQRCAIAMPTELATPCPSGPVVTSTPGT